MGLLRVSPLFVWVLVSCSSGSPANGNGVVGSISDGDEGDPATTGTTGGVVDPSEGEAASSGAVDSTGGEPPELDGGTWVFENVSATPVMGFHPRRALTVDGRELVAWAETAPDDTSTLNIMAARRDGDAWSSEALTHYLGVQNTFPSLVGAPFPILAWSGRTSMDDDDDIFVAVAEIGGWSEVRNLSNALEPAIEARADLRPALVARDDGALAIAYLSAGIGENGLDATPEVFVSEFLLEETPSKRLPLVDSMISTCTDIAGAAAPSGVFHFVMSCNQSGSSTLLQATNRSGEWKTDELAGLGTAILSPQMTRGPNGVHLVWVQSQPCGNESCTEVFHAQTNDEVFGTPVAVTDQVNLDERKPVVGVDPWGRILVLHQAAVDGVMGVYLSVSEDGAAFTTLGRITPDGTPDSYQTPSAIGFDADGLPSFALEVVASGSDPLNIDVYVARFVPG